MEYSLLAPGVQQALGEQKVGGVVNIHGAFRGHDIGVAAVTVQTAGAEEVLRFHKIDGAVHTVVGFQLVVAALGLPSYRGAARTTALPSRPA